MMRNEPIFVLALITALATFGLTDLTTGCTKTPPQSSEIVDIGGNAACKMITVFGGTKAEESLCATAVDIVAMETKIREGRLIDAGADVGIVGPSHAFLRCRFIGAVCATDEEIAAAIRARKAER